MPREFEFLTKQFRPDNKASKQQHTHTLSPSTSLHSLSLRAGWCSPPVYKEFCARRWWLLIWLRIKQQRRPAGHSLTRLRAAIVQINYKVPLTPPLRILWLGAEREAAELKTKLSVRALLWRARVIKVQQHQPHPYWERETRSEWEKGTVLRAGVYQRRVFLYGLSKLTQDIAYYLKA